ncbi:MAG: hypothetical protein Q8Q09_17205, partial [Deltaproteobacteria bacterium]|nr:hypothetical protein [Deltaproteobacteria bacterium]
MREGRSGPSPDGRCTIDTAQWALATLARAYVHGTYGELISLASVGRAPAENTVRECGGIYLAAGSAL